MKEKYITADDVKEILKPIVDEIKQKMEIVNQTAVDDFYSARNITYERTGSFKDSVICHEPKEEYSEKGCLLTYRYSSDDVSVNSWESPWGIKYPGDPEQAFLKAFDFGIHGGPTPSKNGWSFNNVTKTDPIMDLIQQGINEL